MKANEFRLGNTIKFSEREINISRHDIDNMAKMEITEGAISELYQPILLTEEWLLRFGLQMDNIAANIIGWKNDLISISTYSRINVEYYWLRYYQHSTCVRIKYVHELQNLYFALTGQELTINN